MKKEVRISKARAEYRREWSKVCKESDCKIPFGANLQPFKDLIKRKKEKAIMELIK